MLSQLVYSQLTVSEFYEINKERLLCLSFANNKGLKVTRIDDGGDVWN